MSHPVTSPMLKTTRYLIWVYLLALLGEGALRKWIVPGLAGPLLIMRDPIVVVIYLSAVAGDHFPVNGFVRATLGLALLSLLASMVVNPDHLGITLFGLRTNFLHLPLIFLIPRVFDHAEVLRVGRFLLLISPMMLFIVTMQFRSGPDSWWNLGAGAGSGQLSSAFGKVRPSGTFSFTTGLASYIGLLASFVIYNFFSRGSLPRWMTSMVVTHPRTATPQ